MTLRSTILQGTLILAALSADASPVLAYSTHDPWCQDSQKGAEYILDDFVYRGFDPWQVAAAIAWGAAEWTEVQSNIKFTTPVVVPWTHSHGQADPGHIYARCTEEGAGDWEANTWWSTGWSETCGFEIYAWNMIFNADPYGGGCGTGAGTWGTTRGDYLMGKATLQGAAAHEFGHVLGLGHSTVPYSRMEGINHNFHRRLMYDDAEGLVTGLEYGPDMFGSLKTASATYSYPNTTLTFNSPTDVYVDYTGVRWGPAIAGDPSGIAEYDYALVWVNISNHIVLRSVTEGYNDTLIWNSTITTPETTGLPVGVAISSEHKIGIGWAGTDLDRTVNFMVTEQNGEGGFTKTTFWGQHALGGVSVAWAAASSRWVASWVQDRQDVVNNVIAVVVSNDASGTSWPAGPVYFYDATSIPPREGVSPGRRPALACGSADTNLCGLFYSDMNSTVLGMSQLFFAQSWPYPIFDHIYPVPGAVDYGNSNLVYVPLFGGVGVYFALWEQQSVSSAPLTYAMLYDTEIGYNTFHDWHTGPGMSRSGFSGAWNYRLGHLRFVWNAN
jgi:hypothetical protein